MANDVHLVISPKNPVNCLVSPKNSPFYRFCKISTHAKPPKLLPLGTPMWRNSANTTFCKFS